MARDENCPVPRGSTWYNGGTIDSNDLGGANLEGTIWRWEDIDWSNTTQGAKPHRSNRPVYTMLVRNVSAGAILPKRLVTFQKSGLNLLGRVDGYADTTAEVWAAPVDEFLAAAGCPVNDICHVVIEGPAMCMTDLAGGANNLIAVGDILVALTAATSGATTSGRVKPQDLTGATAVLGQECMGALGRALSAKTTAQTNGDVLIDVARRW